MLQSRRIGYCWSERKGQKINVKELTENFARSGYEFVRIDLDIDLDRQGPFDLIIHKLSDLLYQTDCDQAARKQIESFERYLRAHPEIIVIDPIENVSKILDRYHQYKIIEDSDLAKEDGVFTPTFVEMTTKNVDENLAKLKAANVRFPFVCKPMRAQGTRYAHKMSIIFDENGLDSINPPCVAQTFINHNARLYKLFIIKDKYYVIERPSIKNFKPNKHYETVHFDSHDISKPYSSSSLIELDEDDLLEQQQQCSNSNSMTIINNRHRQQRPDHQRFDRIVNIITRELGLYLLGIDVIIENETNRYAIIDMNTFPGYDGVENFCEKFCKIIIDEISIVNRRYSMVMNGHHHDPQSGHLCPDDDDHRQQKSNHSDQHSNSKSSTANTFDIDSGIDTSDSCDEKKNNHSDGQQQTKSMNNNTPIKCYKKQRWHQQQQQQQQSNATNNLINDNGK